MRTLPYIVLPLLVSLALGALAMILRGDNINIASLISTGRKFESTWETQAVSSHRDNAKPWPLLTPKRDEKTILFRFSVGARDRYLQDTQGDNDDQTTTNDDLWVEVEFENVYDTLVFLAVAWILGQLATLIGMPSLVGEIIAGFLLGPPLADYVPFPEAMALLGYIGLVGHLIEAGLEIDVAQLKETGARSFFMAATGSLLPLVVGIVLATIAGEDIRSAVAIGASFSPSSLGVAANALSTGNVLNTPVGQLIVAACVIDEFFGVLMLSVLDVLVDPDGKTYEYFIPILSSFGYLIVLGYSALTWMPRVIEDKILPAVPEARRDFVAFGLMIALVFVYLPLLKYSRANYLTGAFLAGMTFSQIDSVHHSWIHETKSSMHWLVRMLFAATIGFQVPIRMFNDPYVIKWGFIYYISVFAELPLGLFVPKFHDQVPKGFPYNQYWRDVFVVGLAMTCRGEFNFVIATFALSEGIFSPEIYSAVVFAFLLSTITSPFVLSMTIKYYNRLSENFVAEVQPVEAMNDEGCSERTQSSLYIAIQGRTANQWGLQEAFRKALQNTGLVVIDHRSWHPRGRNAVVMTEIYAEDPTLNIRATARATTDCLYKATQNVTAPVPEPTFKGDLSIVKEGVEEPVSTDRIDSLESQPPILHPIQLEPNDKRTPMNRQESLDVETEQTEIEQRCQYIQKVLLGCLEDKGAASIQVSQWRHTTFHGVPPCDESTDRNSVHTASEDDCPTALNAVHTNFDGHQSHSHVFTSKATVLEANGTSASPKSIRRRTHQRSRSSPSLSATSLWEVDTVTHQAAQQGVTGMAVRYDISPGPAYGQTRKKVSCDYASDAPIAEERLVGFVRTVSDRSTRRPSTNS